jgi:acetyl esterase/lipase
MKMIHMPIPGQVKATLEGYILDCEISLGQDTNRPAIVICPGGGYVYCSPREAEPVALRYAAKGFHAFSLRYSTGWDAADFSPLKEVSWVIGYLRAHAEERHIDPDKIATCGFSAGGHLALAAGVLGENKPNAMILGYPAVTTPNHPQSNFMVKLLSGKKEVDDQDCARFSLERFITKDAPPVFMMATAEDGLSPYGALLVANCYSKLGLGYELHMFQHGPHGYSLADETSADGSCQMLNPSVAHWHELSVNWLYRIFGQPTFNNKSTSRMAQIMMEMGLIPGNGADFA